ncbi:MAG: hypothetical protein HYT87_06315 [Nitrospirae bacterium]|nr:hypothetical protein [Nitrospirota bacterium]
MHVWLGVLALLQFSTTSFQFPRDIHSLSPAGGNDFWATGKRGAVCRIQLEPKQESCNYFGDGLITAIDRHGDLMAVAGEGGSMFLSRDRGRTWSRNQTPSSYHLLSIGVVSDTRLIAVGDWGTLLRSEDSGKSWVEQPLEVKFGPDFMGVPVLTRDVADPGSGESYGKGSEIPPQAAATLSDSGHDFFVRNDVILNDILALDDGTLYVAAERGKLFESKDGGKTFHDMALQKSSSASPEDAEAEEGPTLFFVTGDGKVLWTGGSLGTLFKLHFGKPRTFPRVEKIELPIGDNAIFDGDAKGRTICLTGSDGLMAFSFDEGRAWDRVRNPDYDALWFRKALVLPDGSCLFAGQKGTVVKVSP